MAFLKGNTRFPGSRFTVDELTRSWDVLGTSAVDLSDNGAYLSKDTLVSVSYFKLKNMIILTLRGSITPSTYPYSGTEDDTEYLYDGRTQTVLPEQMRTHVSIDVDAHLSVSPFHFENSVSVTDTKHDVFYDTTEDVRIGTMHMNGRLHPTRIVLTIPTGLFPHHTYAVTGELAYEPIASA